MNYFVGFPIKLLKVIKPKQQGTCSDCQDYIILLIFGGTDPPWERPDASTYFLFYFSAACIVVLFLSFSGVFVFLI